MIRRGIFLVLLLAILAPATAAARQLAFVVQEKSVVPPAIAAPETTNAEAPVSGDTVTIVVVGDTGLNGDMQSVRPDGVQKHGDLLSWRETTAGIAAEVNGDLNFMNLETIVSARNSLSAENKSFRFRSHPDGIRHLIGLGFNLFSTANNHSMDFGAAGARDTLEHLVKLEAAGLQAYPGLGTDRNEAGRPWPITVKDTRFMVSGIGIVTRGFGHHRAGLERIGQMSYQAPEDFEQVTARLSQAHSPYRILSVHYGAERAVRPDSSDIARFRDVAVRQRGIDLVLGHHAHVAQGVAMVDGKLIFYGLGNFLHHGTADMSVFGMCRDYGLLARLHLRRMADGRYAARAVEAVPLTNMHRATRPMKPDRSSQRIAVLNYLSQELDDEAAGARGLRFAPRPDGTGLFCAPGAAKDPGNIGKLCAGWSAPEPPSSSLRQRIRSSCGAVSERSASRRGRSSRRSSRKPAKSSKTLFQQVFGF